MSSFRLCLLCGRRMFCSSPDSKPAHNRYLRGAMIVENTGSVARDHLANERTFLAWSRTALALMGAGIALESLDFHTVGAFQKQNAHLLNEYETKNVSENASISKSDNDEDDIFSGFDLDMIPLFLDSRKKHIASVTFVTIGGIFMCYAVRRYFQVMHLLNSGHFKPNVRGVLGTAITAAFLVIGSMFYINSMVVPFNKKQLQT